MKAKKSAKKRVTLRKHRYSESACTSQVLAKGKGKQTPLGPLIPKVVGTCSLSSLEAPKGAIFASSGRDHTLLDRERRPGLVPAVKPGMTVLTASGLCRFWAVVACRHMPRIVCISL